MDRYSGFRIVLLAAPSHLATVALAAFVPGYSGGTVTDSHRLPDFHRSNCRQRYDKPRFVSISLATPYETRYLVTPMNQVIAEDRRPILTRKEQPTALSAFAGIRDRFPFPLGTTSYIVPDNILPNVRLLAKVVDDVEIVVFESDEISNLPDPEVVEELRSLAESNRLTYTIHLPMDVSLGHADGAVRRASVDKCLRVLDRMQPVRPLAVVLHFHHEAYRNGIPAADIPRWQTALHDSVRDLLAAGVAPHNLCIETLSYPFEWVDEIVCGNSLSVCLDVGHILMNGYDLTAHLDRYWTRTRVVHLHGVLDGHDHRDISAIDRRILAQVMERMYGSITPPVLTLEVFNEDDLVKSLQRLEDFAQ